MTEKLAGYGRPLGAEPAARTVARELRLSEDEVLRIHRQALRQMREAMDAKGLGPELHAGATGKLRQRRATAPRDVGRARLGRAPRWGSRSLWWNPAARLREGPLGAGAHPFVPAA